MDSLGNPSDWTLPATTTLTAVTKYYALGGQKVALRQGDMVYFLHGDHLGSTSLTTDENGAVVSEVRYLPYGQQRWSNGGAAVTDFGFTSQRREGFGLYDYNARYYSPSLGRFISPDTIVPEPGSSGGFNRYAYVRNNPLKYTDPTGHAECVDADCKIRINPVTNKRMCGGDIPCMYEQAGEDLSKMFLDAGEQTYEDFFSESFKNYKPEPPTSEEFTNSILEGSQEFANSIWQQRDVEPFTGDYVTNLKFDSDRVNWRDVALDSIGTTLSFVGGNKVATALKIGPRMVNTARATSAGISLNGLAEGYLSQDMNTLITSSGSLVAPPGPWSGGFSLAAVYFDLEPGFYCEPSCDKP